MFEYMKNYNNYKAKHKLVGSSYLAGVLIRLTSRGLFPIPP